MINSFYWIHGGRYVRKPGLGLRDLRTWNKALLVKTLWNIHTKKDTLWVKWVNEFFLRGRPIWDWIPSRDAPTFF